MQAGRYAPPTHSTRTAWFEKHPDKLSASTLRQLRHCTTCAGKAALSLLAHAARVMRPRPAAAERTMSACSGISCAMAPATRTRAGGRQTQTTVPAPASRAPLPGLRAARCCCAGALRARCAARRRCVRGTADASRLRATAARA